MNPENIPFNVLICGPTKSGKTDYLVKQLNGPFKEVFDYIILICPTYLHNKTYDNFGESDDRVFVLIPSQDHIDDHLRLLSYLFQGTNCLVILDDCASSKEVKQRSNQLVNLAFSARHIGISVWVITQQFTSITKAFRQNVGAIILFYTPNKKDLKEIFDNYAGELSQDERKSRLVQLKSNRWSRIVFNL